MDGYWVRTEVKVDLTTAEKKVINRPSSPRWELDVVAYKARENHLYVVECKSHFDSPGVRAACFDGPGSKDAARYKLFNEPDLRRVVFNRLSMQAAEAGASLPGPDIRLALACGKIRNDADRTAIRARFDAEGWGLWDEAWPCERLKRMASRG